MNILKKVTLVLLVIVLCTFYTYCYADIPTEAQGWSTTIKPNSDAGLGATAANVWNSVKLILQVAALSTIVFTGVRYMMASADQKADIKKSSIALVIGVVVVFGTTIIIDFVTRVAGEVLK